MKPTGSISALVAAGVCATFVMAAPQDPVKVPDADAKKPVEKLQGPSPDLKSAPQKAQGKGLKNSWFEETGLDLGTYFQHEKATGRFPFQNPNDFPVTWSSLTGSCTCAAAEIHVGDDVYRLAKTPQPNTLYKVNMEGDAERLERVESIHVPPHVEGVVEVEMEVVTSKGKRGAHLDVHTTDQKLPQFKLQFEALGMEMFQVEPADFNLGKMSWKDQREFTFRVKSVVAKDFEITGYDNLPDGFAIETEKAMQGELAVWTVKGTFGPLKSERGGGGILKLKTDVQGKQDLELRVHATVEGPLTMDPGGFLSLGLVRKGKGTKKTLTITPNDDFELAVTEMEIANLSVDPKFVTLSSRKDGEKVMVDLEVSKDAPSGLVRGDVVIKLNHPASPERKILFNGFVR